MSSPSKKSYLEERIPLGFRFPSHLGHQLGALVASSDLSLYDRDVHLVLKDFEAWLQFVAGFFSETLPCCEGVAIGV